MQDHPFRANPWHSIQILGATSSLNPRTISVIWQILAKSWAMDRIVFMKDYNQKHLNLKSLCWTMAVGPILDKPQADSLNSLWPGSKSTSQLVRIAPSLERSADRTSLQICLIQWRAFDLRKAFGSPPERFAIAPHFASWRMEYLPLRSHSVQAHPVAMNRLGAAGSVILTSYS